MAEVLSVGVRFVEDEQPGIDPHLVHVLHHFQSNPNAVVVNIRHKRNIASLGAQSRTDLAHGFGVGQGGRGHPHDLAADINESTDPGHGSFDVEGVLVDHRLNGHRVLTADGDFADHDRARTAPANHRVVTGIDGNFTAAFRSTGQGAGHGSDGF